MPPITLRSAFAFAVLLGLAACSSTTTPPPAATVALDSDRARASYMVGLDLAQNLKPIRAEVDIDTVIVALRTAHAEQAPLLNTEQADATRKQFTQHLRDQRERERNALAVTNLQRGSEFLAKNAARAEVTTTPSGLQYEMQFATKGISPSPTDTVRVHYIGRHLNGDEFENTYATDHPAEFVLNQVMPGWIEGIGLMGVGAKYRFWLPAKLAFGEAGLSDQIEPNEVVQYDVELLEIAGR